MNKYSIEVGLYSGEIFLGHILSKYGIPYLELEVNLTPDFVGTTGDWLTIYRGTDGAVSVKYEDIKYIEVKVAE